MYLIQCPEGHEITVPAKAAGSSVNCPTCGATQNVPKLGELRRMPEATAAEPAKRHKVLPLGAKVAFAGLILVAAVGGLTAAFAASRWQNMPVLMTQEEHIAAEEKSLGELGALQLIGAAEQIESANISEQVKYPYHAVNMIRNRWKRICLTSLGIAGGAMVVAMLIFAVGRTEEQRVAG